MYTLALAALFLTACDPEVEPKDSPKESTLTGDGDGDGYGYDSDCNDNDGSINPGAVEICDGIDNNCDSVADEGLISTWYADSDGDGFGDAGASQDACEAPAGFVADDTDCDDNDRRINPDATDVCDGVDNNCDNRIDEDADFVSWWPDNDGDGYGDANAAAVSACEDPGGSVDNNDDCDDGDQTIHPNVRDECDGVDNNCDGDVDEDAAFQDWFADDDNDGFGDENSLVTSCESVSGYVLDDSDCNDSNGTIYPGADETCNEVDDDCNGVVDDNPVDGFDWYADRDGDSYGDPANVKISCSQPAGYLANNTDCSDLNASVHPGAAEICDSLDNDCDGVVDDNATDATTWYADVDGDNFGNASVTTVSCTQPNGYVSFSTDCDDSRNSVFPGAPEVCDDIDNDCDGVVDDNATDATTWYSDSDRDSYGNNGQTQLSCDQPSGYVSQGGDCNDADSAIKPGATEVCDSVDNDCDGTTDQNATDATTWYADSDSDTYGNSSVSTRACSQPAGYVTINTDCNDGSATSYPGATEICDGRDNDCDGVVDDGAVDLALLAVDADGDGFGEAGSTDYRCSGVENEFDCDDGDAGEPLVVDVINGSARGTGTLSNPFNTIQAGIDLASSCVVVYPGTYSEAIDFSGKDIIVSSTSGAAATVIDGTGTGEAVVSFANGETAGAELIGFTLQGGDGHLTQTSTSTNCSSNATCTDYYNTYCGGGMYLDGSAPTVRDVIILGNVLPEASTVADGNDTTYTSSYGGGICLMGATLDATGLDIFSNFADQGGGVYSDATSTLSLEQSALALNSATDGGGVNTEGTTTFVNVLSAFNSADGDGASMLMVDGTLTATNMVMAGDTGTALYVSGSSAATVRNSIIYDASGYGLEVDSTASWSGTYNDLYGNALGNYSGVANGTGTNGNISSDPLFTGYTDDGDFSNDDFTLQATSPAKNAGNSSAAYNDADGSRNDMGAYGGPNGTW